MPGRKTLGGKLGPPGAGGQGCGPCWLLVGSYARGDAGVGSDLDMVVVVEASDEGFERRAAGYDATNLPVPVDLPVYTQDEWRRMMDRGGRFVETLRRETVWLHGADLLASVDEQDWANG